MPDNKSIALIDLLRQREEEFIRIWKCEQALQAIPGLEYFPIPAPPDLPSRHKPHKPTPKKEKAEDEEKAKLRSFLLDVRKLLPDTENAYRVVYEFNGKQDCSFQTDRELLRLLLNITAEEFKALSVETVKFNGSEDWTCVEKLWSRS